MAEPYAVTSDSELETAARDLTSYDPDELPGDDTTGQMKGLIDAAKRELHIRTGSNQWYSDLAYGDALTYMTALKMKEAVENVSISSYGIADESVSFTDTDPETSQQIVSWSESMNRALNQSELSFDTEQDFGLRNTGAFIG